MSNLILLAKKQIKSASRIICEAFFNDPLMLYLFPKPKKRKRKLKSMMELLLRLGRKYGIVNITSPKLEGIAIWFPSNKAKITPLMGILNGGISYFFKTGSKAVKKQNRIYSYLYSKHKELMPSLHWYLSIIAIKPTYQGKGLSHVLFNSIFNQIDSHHLPCFLDTNNPKNVPMYERFGFKTIQKYEIIGTNIENWAMIRYKK